MNDKRFALLIDSDNISAKYIDCILQEISGNVQRFSGINDFFTKTLQKRRLLFPAGGNVNKGG